MPYAAKSVVLYRPPLDWILIALFGVLVLVAVFAAVRAERTRFTALLRLIGLAGLIYLLAGPSITTPNSPADVAPPKLQVLIDTSASMAQPDGGTNDNGSAITRLEAIERGWLSEDRLSQLGRSARVELLAFDEQSRALRPGDLRAEGDATRLYDALGRARADATLILSDGHDNDPQSARQVFQEAGRLFAVPVGSPRSSPDLAIDAWPESDRLMEGQATSVRVMLKNRGFSDRWALSELIHRGEVIDQRRFQLLAGEQSWSYEIKPELEPGRVVEAKDYRVRVRLDAGEEAYAANNEQAVFVQVSRGKAKVLLIEGEPYWDTRSLARLIGAHPRFDLTALYGFGESRRSRVLGERFEIASDPSMELNRFDVVVLGRRVERMVDLGFADRLDRFVRDGGAVLFARGEPFGQSQEGRSLSRATSSISPAAWGRRVLGPMRVQLADTADPGGPLADLQDEAVVSRLPGMLAATQIEGRQAASLVLLEQQQGDGPAMAAVTTLRVGSGASMAVLTEGLWRWELLPGVGDDRQAESVYGTFWVRALQWLASGGEFLPGQDIAIEADRLMIEPEEQVTLSVSTRYIEPAGLNLKLQAVDSDGNTRDITLSPASTPGHFTARFTPQATGVYRFELSAPDHGDLIAPGEPVTTQVAVIERSEERRDTAAQPDRLKQITESTGGQCLAMDETGPLLDYLQTLRAIRGSEDSTDYDFNTWPAFLWIAGCFGLEWVLRRRSGLR